MTVSREEFDALKVRVMALQAQMANSTERAESLEALLEGICGALITEPPASVIRRHLRTWAEREAGGHDPLRDMAIRLLDE